MKPTQFLAKKSELTAFAKAFRLLHPKNWYLRTTLECNHRVNERRKSIVLISDEKVVQRLILCGICKKANVEPKNL